MRWRSWQRSTSRPSASKTSESLLGSWSAKCHAGFRSWSPTKNSKTIPARTFPESTTSRPGWKRVGRRHGRPATGTRADMPGDYHAANVMFSRTGPELVAIVDWEMCTIGDPLLDLGWLLATWRQSDATSAFGGTLFEKGGLAGASDLVEQYARNTTRHLSHITWYTVLACFKLGIVLEGTQARASAGKAPKEVGELLHAATVS